MLNMAHSAAIPYWASSSRRNERLGSTQHEMFRRHEAVYQTQRAILNSAVMRDSTPQISSHSKCLDLISLMQKQSRGRYLQSACSCKSEYVLGHNLQYLIHGKEFNPNVAMHDRKPHRVRNADGLGSSARYGHLTGWESQQRDLIDSGPTSFRLCWSMTGYHGFSARGEV